MDKKDFAECYFEHGVDIQNRRVFIGEIDSGSVDATVKGIYFLDSVDSGPPIELFVSSCGGDIYGSLAIHDVCKTIKSPVHVFAFGVCMSAAVLLLAAGEPGHRWVSENCQLMFHDGFDSIEGKTTSIRADVKHLERLEKLWTNLLVKYSNKDYRWWDTRAKKSGDFYFSAEEAIEFGIADQIWNEKS